MKHPALTRIFSLVLAVLCLTMLLAGIGVVRFAIKNKAAELADHQRLSDRIEEYREIRAGLDGKSSYAEISKKLQEQKEKHEEMASQHRMDLAIYTATQGGIQAGEEALLQAESAFREGKAQYEAGLAAFLEQEKAFWDGYNQFQEGKKQLQEGRKTLELAESALSGLRAELERSRALAAILESDDENARQELTVAAYDSLLASLDDAMEVYGTLKSQGGISPEQMQLLAQMLAEESGADVSELLDNVTWEGISAESLEELETQVRETTGMSVEEIRATIQQQRDEAAQMDAESPISEEEFAALQAAYAQSRDLIAQVDGLMEEKLNEYETQLSETKIQLDEAQKQMDAMEPVLEQGKTAILQARAALELAGEQIRMGEASLADGRRQLEEQKAELAEKEKTLRKEKTELDRQAEEIAELSVQAETLKDLESREKSVRLMLLDRDGIRERTEQGMELLAAADDYAALLLRQIQERFGGRLWVGGLMALAAASGFAGIPAAFEKSKSRFWLIAPVLSCLLCAAGVEALCRYLGRGDSYSALGTGVFALIQLALVIPKKKKPVTGG